MWVGEVFTAGRGQWEGDRLCYRDSSFVILQILREDMYMNYYIAQLALSVQHHREGPKFIFELVPCGNCVGQNE